MDSAALHATYPFFSKTPRHIHPLARYNICMADAKQNLEQYYFEMRWRCLSLAADLDRVERAQGGRALLDSDPRLLKLRDAIGVLLKPGPNRAEQVQMIFSDKTPPPDRK